MSRQFDYPRTLRLDLEGRATSLMEMADWLSWLSQEAEGGNADKLAEVADFILDSAGIFHVLATDKAQAGALLQGHVLPSLHLAKDDGGAS